MDFTRLCFINLFLTCLTANLANGSGDWKDLNENTGLNTFVTAFSTELEVNRQLAAYLRVDVSDPSLVGTKPVLYRDTEHTILKYDVLFEVPLTTFTIEKTHTQFRVPFQIPYLTFIATISEYQENVKQECFDPEIVTVESIVTKRIAYNIQNFEESVLSKMVAGLSSCVIPQELKKELTVALSSLHEWAPSSINMSRESESLAEMKKFLLQYMKPADVVLKLKYLGKTVEGSASGTPDVYVAIYEFKEGKAMNWVGAVFKILQRICNLIDVVKPIPILDSTEQVKLMDRNLLEPLNWANFTQDNPQGLFDFIRFTNKWPQKVMAIFNSKTQPFLKRAQDGERRVYFCSLRTGWKSGVSRATSTSRGIRTSIITLENVESQDAEWEVYLLVAVLENRGTNPYQILNYSFNFNIQERDYKEHAEAFRYRIPAI